MRTSTYTRIGNLMALFTERYTSADAGGTQTYLNDVRANEGEVHERRRAFRKYLDGSGRNERSP